MKVTQNYSLWSKISTVGLLTLMLVFPGVKATEAGEEKINTPHITIAQNQPPKVGQPAPDFTGVDSNGKTHKLSDFKGKIVVLEWTNNDCPFVKKHYESNNMQQLQKEMTAEDVVWLSIISSGENKQGYVSAAEANELSTNRGAQPTAVILDPSGEIGKLYSARTTPHMFVIDKEGVLQYMGAIDDNPSSNKADAKTANNYVKDAVNSLMNNQPVKTAVTQPYGCSVKYGG